jgi:hypothetical protein
MNFNFRKVSSTLLIVSLLSAGISPAFATMPDGTPHENEQPTEQPHDNGHQDHPSKDHPMGGGHNPKDGDTDNSINQDIKADSTSYGSQQGQSIGDTNANGGSVQDSGNSSVGNTSATGGSTGPIKNNNNSTGGSVGDTSATGGTSYGSTQGQGQSNDHSGNSTNSGNGFGGAGGSTGSIENNSAGGNGGTGGTSYGSTSENHNNANGGQGGVGNGGAGGSVGNTNATGGTSENHNNSAGGAGGMGGLGGTSSANGGAGGSAQNGPINVNPTLTNGPNTLTNGPNTNTQNGAPQTTTVTPTLTNGPNTNSSISGGNTLKNGSNSAGNNGVTITDNSKSTYRVAPAQFAPIPGNPGSSTYQTLVCLPTGQTAYVNSNIQGKSDGINLTIPFVGGGFGYTSTRPTKNEAYWTALSAQNQTRAELMTADGVASHPLGGLFLDENTQNTLYASGQVRHLSVKEQLALSTKGRNAVQATIVKSKSGSVAMGCGKLQGGGQVIIDQPQTPVTPTAPEVPVIQVPQVPSIPSNPDVKIKN